MQTVPIVNPGAVSLSQVCPPLMSQPWTWPPKATAEHVCNAWGRFRNCFSPGWSKSRLSVQTSISSARCVCWGAKKRQTLLNQPANFWLIFKIYGAMCWVLRFPLMGPMRLKWQKSRASHERSVNCHEEGKYTVFTSEILTWPIRIFEVDRTRYNPWRVP